MYDHSVVQCAVLMIDARQDSEGWKKRYGLVSAEPYGPAAQSSMLHVLYSIGLTWRCSRLDIRLDICHDGSKRDPSCYSACPLSNRFIAGSGDVIHSNVVVFVYGTTSIPCHAVLPTKAFPSTFAWLMLMHPTGRLCVRNQFPDLFGLLRISSVPLQSDCILGRLHGWTSSNPARLLHRFGGNSSF